MGMKDRWIIAVDAFRVFLLHPIFGVGIDNYSLYSSFGLYAHSTILELLAGTGIFGTILFLCPYFSVIKTLFNHSIKKSIRMDLFELFFCLFALSTVMIIPYGMPLSFFSIILFAETDRAKRYALT